MLFALENFLFSVLCILNFQVFADEISSVQISKTDIEFAQQVSDAKKFDLEEIYKTAKELEFVTGKLSDIGEGAGCKDCGSKIQNIQNKEADIENGIIVFVSFAMPKRR